MKLFFSLLIALVIINNATAQNYFTIKGKVTNEVNGQPMQAASVFAQNTTIGTATDAEGNFTLQLPQGGYDIAFSFTGFSTETKRISTADANEKITISLKEKQKELEVVSVVSSNEVLDGLEKYGNFFKQEFIGKSANSKQCSVQNPEVLHFFYSKKRNRLKVTATDVLLIKNEALGYNIKYAIDSFTHEYNTEISTYSGYPLYEQMVGDSLQQNIWKTNRQAAYKGSVLHFMRSVYNRQLQQNDFEIQFIVNGNGKQNAIKIADVYAALNYEKDDSTQTVDLYPNQDNVGILFKAEKPSTLYINENPTEPKDFKFSILNFKPTEPITIEQNGYYYDQNNLIISGYWAWDKVAEQLPYDYIGN